MAHIIYLPQEAIIVKYRSLSFEYMFGKRGVNVKQRRVVALGLILILLMITIAIPLALLIRNEGDTNDDLKVDDISRGEYTEGDMSIFRGLTSEQIYEIVRRSLDSPELDEETVIYSYSFEKEVHYDFKDGSYLNLRTEMDDWEPVDHFVVIRPGYDDENGTTTDLAEAVETALGFTENLLLNFNCSLGDRYVVELEDKHHLQGWKIDIKQTFNNIPMSTTGIKVDVDTESGFITNYRVWDWIFTDEVEQPVYDWTHGSEEIGYSLEKINYTTEILLHSEPEPNYSIGWSEFVNHPINSSRIEHEGYGVVMGRYCVILEVGYWVDGNFSNIYNPAQDWSALQTTWVNGTVINTHQWLFDTKTGKLLQWNLYGEKGSTGQKIHENLLDGNTTWDEHFLLRKGDYIRERHPELLG